SATSRYSPVNHICTRPPGVSISRHTRRLPPGRTSIFATGTVAPSGPYHALKCSGSVHICQMRSAGASKLRSITNASCDTSRSVIVFIRLSLRSESREVAVHPVEAGLPDGPVLLGPGRDLLERRGVEGAWPVLGSLAPHDQAGPFLLPPLSTRGRSAGGTDRRSSPGHSRRSRSLRGCSHSSGGRMEPCSRPDPARRSALGGERL